MINRLFLIKIIIFTLFVLKFIFTIFKIPTNSVMKNFLFYYQIEKYYK